MPWFARNGNINLGEINVSYTQGNIYYIHIYIYIDIYINIYIYIYIYMYRYIPYGTNIVKL